MKRIIWGALAGLALSGCATVPAHDGPGPIAVYGNKQTFEIAPVLLAAEDFYPEEAQVHMGSIANLVGEPAVSGFGQEGVADVATNAETQALRYSVKHPNLRIVMSVTDGLYRVVARRSAGIRTIADLKGKKVATIEQTSAGYFMRQMLATEGLTFDDIEAKLIVPLAGMTEALRKGEVDAVVIWEPESENAAQVLGEDLIEFTGERVYAERFGLNTTAEALADPARRRKVVTFIRAIIDATAAMKRDPKKAKALLVEAGEFDAQDVEESWKHHDFRADMFDGLLDVLVEQEVWLAQRDKRPARGRPELAKLIDRSAYDEAVALAPLPARSRD